MDLKGNGSGVVAFDKLTGKVRVQHQRRAGQLLVSPVLATIGDRRWCFVFARGGLIGFDPATGKVDFHYPWRAKILESVNASNPVVVGDKVFISETYGPGSALLKVKPGGYEEVWTDAEQGRATRAMQCHWMTPIYVDGYLYGCSGRHKNNAELRCIELATGKVMWSEPDLTRCSLLLVDGHFVCSARTGAVAAAEGQSEEVRRGCRALDLKRTEDGEESRSLRSTPPGRRRCCRTACCTSAATTGWCAWS